MIKRTTIYPYKYITDSTICVHAYLWYGSHVIAINVETIHSPIDLNKIFNIQEFIYVFSGYMRLFCFKLYYYQRFSDGLPSSRKIILLWGFILQRELHT